MILNVVDMEQLIKKNFMLTSAKLRHFAENNSVQMSLREDVEEANKEIEELKKENKKLRDKLYSNDKNMGDSKIDDAT